MRPNRLLGHLAVRYFAVCLAALMVFGWLASLAFNRALTQSTWAELEATANLAATEVAPQLAANQPAQSDPVRRIAQSTRTRITLILPDGQVVWDTFDDPRRMNNHADRQEVRDAIAGTTGRGLRYSDTRFEPMLYVAVPVRHEGQTVGVARAARSAPEIEQMTRDCQWSLLRGLMVVAAVAGLACVWLARRTSRLVEPLSHGAELLSQGQTIPKLVLPDIEELAALARSLNKIAQQLEERRLRIGQQGHEQQAVLASMVEGVLAVDSSERVITLNSAAAALIGNKQADLHGRSLQEVIRNADLRRFVGRALESSIPVEDDVVLHGDGERVFRVRGTALRDGTGRGVGAVIVLNDVTRYRHLENLRRDFVANVSHELKTPIASIKGFVETLLDGALQHADDAQRFLKIIASHAERLNNIIEDLLSLSKIEQSEEAADLPLSEVPLRPVLEAALRACQPQADARQVALSLRCDDNLLAQVNPPLFEQAVINLVDNAVKYSEPSGDVAIEALDSGHEISVAIRDHGCGIAAEHLPRLFERFYRVDRARSRKLGGTGLGLAIVKHIVQAHRGRVSVTSTPGEGSVFSIHLPLPVAAPVSLNVSPAKFIESA